MKRTIDKRFVGVSVSVVALLAGFSGCRAFRANSDSEDRSPIIVRSGSVVFEDDADWEYETSSDKKKARPNQPNGANVTGFQVTFERNEAAESCPQVPIVGDSVDFGSSTSTPVTLTAKLHGSNTAPFITAPGDMAIDNAGSKKKLTYGAAGGITSVTVHYGPGTVTCTPRGDKFTKVDVKPLR